MGTVKLLIISILAITLGSCNSDENINASTDTALLLSKKGAESIMSNQHNPPLGKSVGTLKSAIKLSIKSNGFSSLISFFTFSPSRTKILLSFICILNFDGRPIIEYRPNLSPPSTDSNK